jgi:hypothetical protein
MQDRPLTITKQVPTSTGNLLNPPTTTGGVPSGEFASGDYQDCRIVLTHMRVINTTAGALTISLFRGLTVGTAAGTELAWSGTSVPGNSYLDWYGRAVFDTTKFLSGSASGAGLTLDMEGSIGIA